MTVASHLKSLQALDLALRTGSLKGAADMLGITPAAAGQRIKVLEDYLGFELLTRGRSGLRPTPELSDAVEPLAAAFDKLKIVGQRLDFQRANEIHIAANPDFVDLWLSRRLARYRGRLSQHLVLHQWRRRRAAAPGPGRLHDCLRRGRRGQRR